MSRRLSRQERQFYFFSVLLVLSVTHWRCRVTIKDWAAQRPSNARGHKSLSADCRSRATMVSLQRRWHQAVLCQRVTGFLQRFVCLCQPWAECCRGQSFYHNCLLFSECDVYHLLLSSISMSVFVLIGSFVYLAQCFCCGSFVYTSVGHISP